MNKNDNKDESPSDYDPLEGLSPVLKNDWERHKAKLRKTSSQKKIWNFLEDLVQKPDFKKRIAELRRECEIPDGGFKKIESAATGPNQLETICWPSGIDGLLINNGAKEIAEEHGLNDSWIKIIELYIIYNRIDLADAEFGSLISVLDIWTEAQISQDDDIHNLTRPYPVAILLSPYISQNDLINYIKTFFAEEIKPILDYHKRPGVRIGISRKKNARVKDRDNFIWNNRELGPKKLVSAVSNEFGDILDYTHIQKIIKREKKKRSELG